MARFERRAPWLGRLFGFIVRSRAGDDGFPVRATAVLKSQGHIKLPRGRPAPFKKTPNTPYTGARPLPLLPAPVLDIRTSKSDD